MKQKNRGINRKAWLCAMVVTSAVLLQAPGAAFAEEQQEFALDQVVVTATKTPVKQFEANANITVITKEKIEQQHYSNLEQALRDVPGVSVNNYGSPGYDQSNKLRINGSDKIVVLIDGVRANQGDLYFPATVYNTMENIERIEVLKGSASALYGADAQGGVINIITRKIEGNKTTLSISGGSFSKENYSIINEGISGDWSYRVSAKKDLLGSIEDGKGKNIPQSLNGETTGFQITKQLKENSDITVSYDSYKSNYMYLSQYYDDWSSGTPVRVPDFLAYGKLKTNNMKMIFNYEIDDSTHNRLSIMNSDYDAVNHWSARDRYKTLTIQEQLTKRVNDHHTVTAGIDFIRDKLVEKTYLGVGNVKMDNKALYLQDEWMINKQWELTTGFRYDDNSMYDSESTPHIALGFKVDQKTNYYLSYGEFFNTPTSYQLWGGTFGNSKLRPETGENVEFGFNHRISDTFTVAAHAFKRRINEKIAFDYFSNQYYNLAADERSTGWNIELNKKVTDQFSTYIGYTHTNVDATASSTANVDGNIPKGAWNIGLDYSKDKLDVGVQGRGIINRDGKPGGANAFPTSTYWIWDIGVNYKVNQAVKAYAKVNNIFDKYYAEQSNVAYGAPGEWWAMPGRNVIVGMSYTF
ncbi:MAG: cirA 4 [Anaerospora sp.]|nr:cirA 4 [Anaerospora sp.]